MNKRAFKRIILLFAIAFLCLFLQNVDFSAVYTHIHQVGWGFLLLLLVTGTGYFLAAVAWYLSFRSIDLKHAFRQLFIFRMIGETLAVINPTSVIAGDASKVYFLKQAGVAVDEASAATLISRMLLVTSLIFILICSSFFFFNTVAFFENFALKIAALSSLAFLAFGMLYLFISEKLYLDRISAKLLPYFFKDFTTKKEAIYKVNFAMADYFKNHKLKFIAAFILSVFHWFSGALEFYVILFLLNIPISMANAVMMEMGVMIVKSLGAFVPGQIGVEEQGNRLMLAAIGVQTAGIWVVVSILRRARQVVWLGIGFLLYLFFYQED